MSTEKNGDSMFHLALSYVYLVKEYASAELIRKVAIHERWMPEQMRRCDNKASGF